MWVRSLDGGMWLYCSNRSRDWGLRVSRVGEYHWASLDVSGLGATWLGDDFVSMVYRRCVYSVIQMIEWVEIRAMTPSQLMDLISVARPGLIIAATTADKFSGDKPPSSYDIPFNRAPLILECIQEWRR